MREDGGRGCTHLLPGGEGPCGHRAGLLVPRLQTTSMTSCVEGHHMCTSPSAGQREARVRAAEEDRTRTS